MKILKDIFRSDLSSPIFLKNVHGLKVESERDYMEQHCPLLFVYATVKAESRRTQSRQVSHTSQVNLTLLHVQTKVEV